MAYNASNDKVIKTFEYKDGQSSIMFSLFSYNGGELKLQMHRIFEKDDGEMRHGKIGRMTKKEVRYLKENINEMLTLMEKE